MRFKKFTRPQVLWSGDQVCESMKYVENVASTGYLKHLYTFKVAQILLDALDKTVDFYISRERSGEYIDMWLTLSDDIKSHNIGQGGLRYFIMTEFVDQLSARLRVLKWRQSVQRERWQCTEEGQKKYNKLIACIEGIDNFYKNLTDCSKWNYIFWDMNIIIKNANRFQLRD